MQLLAGYALNGCEAVPPEESEALPEGAGSVGIRPLPEGYARRYVEYVSLIVLWSVHERDAVEAG